jgi:hypothetical protein
MRKLSITAGVVLLIAATLAGIARRLTAKDAKLRLKDGTWHEEGGYANAQAALKEPGKPTQQVLLGFARSDGAWRIILAEVMP